MHSVRRETSDKIKNMMYVKIHRSKHSEVIAVCDKNLIGKKISQGAVELIITESFYKGDLMAKEKVIELLTSATNANLVGEESVSCGVAAKIITEDSIITIGGIKHAQFYSLS